MGYNFGCKLGLNERYVLHLFHYDYHAFTTYDKQHMDLRSQFPFLLDSLFDQNK